MRLTIAMAAVAVALPLGGASAQSFGDTNLSYFGGVVYDDDLVPGRGPNQSFLVGEERRAVGTSADVRVIPRNSPNLIGSDGRIRDIIDRNQPSTDRLGGR